MGDQAKNDGGKTGDDVEKVGGKVVGEIINESKEDDDDDDEGHQKWCSNKKKRKE
jgi:hypothetical protein